MHSKPSIFALTLATSELAESEAFYRSVFDLEPIFRDEVSVIFKFGEVMVNILDGTAAVGLFAPDPISDAGSHRGMLTIQVENVDEEANRLRSLGVELHYGPLNQPWGIRVITFKDPAGQMWELAQPIDTAK
ncbi:MAG: hypothetical protein RLZZ626_1133 [Actinomycetota bacterium]|jgi:catechol 2,3-dioxygenase-like lactoylglutathione lyase family enzyme